MLFRTLFGLFILLFATVSSRAQEPPPFLPVSGKPTPGSMPLASGDQPTFIYYDRHDARVVEIAATALGDDVARVTGHKATVSGDAPVAAVSAVLMGTVGQSTIIDRLIAEHKIEVGSIQGKWEAYTAVVVSDPLPGIKQGLVIAGSDRRGTAFGIFGLSEAMGVSPWYWWADVVPASKPALYVGPGVFTEGSPGVKYRGIFLNDEDWGLQPWAAKTFEPETGDIGPKTYAKVFELLLRLHANFCWPAMHDVTHPFNTFPQNKVVADDYAIVMGSSHHEPMLRDTSEYDPSKLGPYNYFTNRVNIYKFWDQRVAENGRYENIYTVGMRGQTDDGMIAPPGTTTPEKAREIQDFVLPDQRHMLAEHVNPDPAKVPQIFVPYKEALLQYQAGLRVPTDVTLVWPDDNHGYIRELSTSVEQARSGGSGVYYHLSYWGTPRDYLWLCTTPPAFTWEEMSKAWDYGARRLWIANVGDLKPGEIGLDFFLHLARNPEAYRQFDQHAYLAGWAARTFGADHAQGIAEVLDEYYRLNVAVRPEHLNLQKSGFSLTSNGDEAQRRVAAFGALVSKANALAESLPANLQDAYSELVLYPVRASADTNRKVLLAERSRLFALQGRASTASVAAAARTAYDAVQGETHDYNTAIAHGKWNRMMSDDPHPGAHDFSTMPTVGSYTPPAAAGLGAAVEGAAAALAAAKPGILPTFNPAANQRYFIDVFDTGTEPLSWTAQASEPWITLSQNAGTSDARLLAGVEWTRVPHGGEVSGTVYIHGAGETRTVEITALNPPAFDPGKIVGPVENDGNVTIAGERFMANQPGVNGATWKKVVGSAASYNGMTIFPTTTASVASTALQSAPALSYNFYAFSTGLTSVRTACLPTHRINSEHPGARFAIALNDEAPQIINVDADEYSKAWDANVLRATAYGTSSHTIKTPGPQVLRIWMVDPGVVLDKFDVRIGYRRGGEFEAEDLPVSSTPGRKFRAFEEPAASGNAAVALEAVNPGDQVTFALSDLREGAYELELRVKEMNNRGKIQPAIADAPEGPFRDLGEEVDLYSSSENYRELAPVHLSVDSAGTKYLKLRVTGRNPANTSGQSWIVVDRFNLVPAGNKRR